MDFKGKDFLQLRDVSSSHLTFSSFLFCLAPGRNWMHECQKMAGESCRKGSGSTLLRNPKAMEVEPGGAMTSF